MERARSLLLTVMMALAAGAAAQEPLRPLPLDPLTPAERDLATRLADVDPRVREMIGAQSPWQPQLLILLTARHYTSSSILPPSNGGARNIRTKNQFGNLGKF